MSKKDLKNKMDEIIRKIDDNTDNVLAIKKLLEQPSSPDQEHWGGKMVWINERNYRDLVEIYGSSTDACFSGLCNSMITDAIIRGQRNDKSR